MQFYKDRLLSPGQLKRLSEHKYSCTSKSLLDGLLQPWWDWLVSKVPLWLAPNLITVLGLIVNIVTTLILVYYSPDARAEAPRWACFLCALGLFIYQSLDAIDGKQARRTGTSTPLGELFDHGCDSISTVFVALSACIAVQLGYYPTWMFFQCFCAMTLFYCAHWQTYVSGSLRFGKVDVTEAQFTIIAIHLISAIFGPQIWMIEIPFLDGFMFKYLLGVMTVVCALANLYSIFSVIFTGGVGKNGSTVAIPVLGVGTFNCYIAMVFYAGYVYVFLEFCKVFESGGIGKNGSTIALPYTGTEVKVFPLWAAVGIAILLAQSSISVILAGGVGKNGSTVAGTSVLSPIIPFSFVVVPAFIIYRKSAEHVYENHPALYILAFGMVAAKVTNRLVVAHMTKNEMQYLDSSLIGPAMLFLNQYFNFFIKEYYVLWLCFIWVTLDLFRYSAQVCLEICDHMKIKLFRIPCNHTGTIQVNAAEKNGTNSSHDGGGRAAVRRGIPSRIRHGRRPLIYISLKLLVSRSAHTRPRLETIAITSYRTAKVIKFAPYLAGYPILLGNVRETDCAGTIARGMKLVCLTLQMHAYTSRTCSRIEKRFVPHSPFCTAILCTCRFDTTYTIILDGNSTKSEHRRYDCTELRARLLIFFSCYVCACQIGYLNGIT